MTSIIVFIAGYIYKSQKLDTDAVVAPITEVKLAPAVPAHFEETLKYDELWKQGGCKSSEEKAICEKLKEIWFSKEHLLIKENVYIFVNLTKERSYRGQSISDSKVFAEIMLSSLSTHPLIRALDKPAYAVGFQEIDNKAELKFVLTQNVKEIPVIDLKMHKSIFSRAVIGEQWLFLKIIHPALTIKSLD